MIEPPAGGTTEPPAETTTEAGQAAPRTSLRAIFRQGLRSAFLLKPDWSVVSAGPWTIALQFVITILLRILFDRLIVDGAARFYWAAILGGWYGTVIALWVCWTLGPEVRQGEAPGPRDVASLFAVLVAQAISLQLLSGFLYLTLVRGTSGHEPPPWLAWTAWIGVGVWYAVAQLGLVWRLKAAGKGRRAVASILLTGSLALGMSHPPAHYWYPKSVPGTGTTRDEAIFKLDQEVMEAQPKILDRRLHEIGPSKAGFINFYAITFAPYAEEDVFRRESEMVAALMQERFAADGRTIQLVNNRGTVHDWPWATPLNLKRAIDRVAEVMDREKDVLFIHLTSHGAQHGELSAMFWPLDVDSVTPSMLKGWLDEARIRYRVISVSACYSGSWVEPLAGPDTLIMTAADADHTSYGCGRGSPLTYFGKAMFDEQLRKSWSFEQAHAAARTIIEQREQAAGKSDGYSNPQIRVGEGIRPKLAAFEQERARLGGARHAIVTCGSSGSSRCSSAILMD